MKEIDYKAFAFLTIHGKNLSHLNISNCELVDYIPNGDLNSDEEYDRRQAYINMAKEASEMVEVFESLQHLRSQSFTFCMPGFCKDSLFSWSINGTFL